jgi:hypothetical protein
MVVKKFPYIEILFLVLGLLYKSGIFCVIVYIGNTLVMRYNKKPPNIG